MKDEFGILAVLTALLLPAVILCCFTGPRVRTGLVRMFSEDPELKRTRSEILWPARGEILENGPDGAKSDLVGLSDTGYYVDEEGAVNVTCSPLHMLRIFGGIANEYVLMVAAFSKPTMADAPQKDIPEKVAEGIMRLTSSPLIGPARQTYS